VKQYDDYEVACMSMLQYNIAYHVLYFVDIRCKNIIVYLSGCI
jgi:hypothetical protein